MYITGRERHTKRKAFVVATNSDTDDEIERFYEERLMPSQKAAATKTVRRSMRRRLFLRAARTIMAMVQRRKPSSGQNRREPRPVLV